MRVLVLSDSHGDAYSVLDAVNSQPSARVIIHLGDGADDMDRIIESFPEKTVLQVRGNCDFGSLLPYTGLEIVGGKRIFYTHGHTQGVKMGMYRLISDGRDNKADIILYGHTHKAVTEYEDGVYIMNPGSVSGRYAGFASYGIIDITEAGIVCNIVEVK